MPGEWKYGVRGHNPRCACPDCNEIFRAHNRERWCDCGDCAAHREIGAPLPPTTSYDDMVAAQRQQPLSSPFRQGWVYIEEQPKRKEQSVSTIHMCSRPGCNAIIKRDALGLVSIQPAMDEEQRNMELCPDCTGDVWRLLNSEPEEGTRKRAYDKPFRPDEDATNEPEQLVDEAALGKALLNLLRRNGFPDAKELESSKDE